jgi:Na+/glutamate symporter
MLRLSFSACIEDKVSTRSAIEAYLILPVVILGKLLKEKVNIIKRLLCPKEVIGSIADLVIRERELV